MQVSSMIPGPPVHPGRGAGRPAAAAPPAEATTAGRPTAVAAEEGDEPTKPGGSQTPFTHALHQGNGNKTGIYRRLEAADAAQKYQAELGLTPPAAETGEEATVPPPVETAPEAPALDPDPVDLSAPEPLDPIGVDLPPVDPIATDLLDALEEAAAAPTEPEPA